MLNGSKPSFFIILFLFLSVLVVMIPACSTSGNGSDSGEKPEKPFTYHEFDGVHLYYETDDLTTYRELLPEVFDMPDNPLVRVYVIDFYEMDQNTEPYLEAAVFLLAEYEGEPAWHCITMPVTSEAALLGGIIYLGYPKIMGEITLVRDNGTYTGTLVLNGNTIMTITLNTEGHIISTEEEQVFQRIAGIPNLNILNGEIFRPVFGTSNDDSGEPHTILEMSQMFPDKLIVQVGDPILDMNSAAAGEYSEKLGKLFSIAPTSIVLAHYLKNKFVMSFQN